MKYIKYEHFSEIQVGDEVKIIAEDSWNNMFGIVERIITSKYDGEYNMAVIFCIENPDLRYMVFPCNLDTVVKVEG